MQTKNAIGNLINRYRAVLKKCNLLNTFGTLAIASAFAMSGAGVASAAAITDFGAISLGSDSTAGADEFTVAGDNSGNLVFTGADGKNTAIIETISGELGTVTIDANTAATTLDFKYTTDTGNYADFYSGNISFDNTSANTATMNIDEGTTYAIINNGNTIDGGGDADKSVLNINGELFSSISVEDDIFDDLTIGNSNGATVYVGANGSLIAKILTLDNGAKLNAAGRTITVENYNGAHDTDGKIFATTLVLANGNVTADTINLIGDNSDNTYAGGDALQINSGAVKAAVNATNTGISGALSVDSNNILALTLNGWSKVTGNVTVGEGGTFTVDKAEGNGEAAIEQGVLTVSNGTVDIKGVLNIDDSNTSNSKGFTQSGGTVNLAEGAVLKVAGDTGNAASITGGTFTHNGASYFDQGIVVDNGASLTVKDATTTTNFDNETKANGILYVGDSKTVKLDNSSFLFVDNAEGSFDGAILDGSSKGTVVAKGTLTNTTLSNNLSAIAGTYDFGGSGDHDIVGNLTVLKGFSNAEGTLTTNGGALNFGLAADAGDAIKKFFEGVDAGANLTTNLVANDGDITVNDGAWIFGTVGLEANGGGFVVNGGTVTTGAISADNAGAGNLSVTSGSLTADSIDLSLATTNGGLVIGDNNNSTSGTVEVSGDLTLGNGGLTVDGGNLTVTGAFDSSSQAINIAQNSASEVDLQGTAATSNSTITLGQSGTLKVGIEQAATDNTGGSKNSNWSDSFAAGSAGKVILTGYGDDGDGKISRVDLNNMKTTLLGSNSGSITLELYDSNNNKMGVDLTGADLNTIYGEQYTDEGVDVTADTVLGDGGNDTTTVVQSLNVNNNGNAVTVTIGESNDATLRLTGSTTDEAFALNTAEAAGDDLSITVKGNSTLGLGGAGADVRYGTLNSTVAMEDNSTLNAVNGKFTVTKITAGNNGGTIELENGASLTISEGGIKAASVTASGTGTASENELVAAADDIEVTTAVDGAALIAEAGDIDVSNAAVTNGASLIAENGTVTAGTITSAKTINAKTLTASGAVTLTGGEFNLTGTGNDASSITGAFTADNMSGTVADITFGSTAKISNGSDLDFGKVEMTGGNLTIGDSVSDSNASTVTIENLKLGSNKLVAESKTGVDPTVVAVGGFTDSNGNASNEVNGLVEAKTNSIVVLGSRDTAAALAAVITDLTAEDGSTKTFGGTGDYLGAVYIAAPLTLDSNNGGIAAGSSASAESGKIKIGADGLMVVDGNNANPAISEVDGSNSNVAIAGGVNILRNGQGDVTLFSGSNLDGVNLDLSNGQFFTNNRYLAVENITQSDTAVTVSVAANSSNNPAYSGFSDNLGSLVAAAANAGTNEFINNVANNGLLTDAQAAAVIEGAAKAPMIIGAPKIALDVATIGSDYAMARTSFAPRVAGAYAMDNDGQAQNIASGDNMANGMNVWIMPMYEHASVDGLDSGLYTLDYDTDFYGVAVGADYTWDNSFRLGATLNFGTGDAETKSGSSFSKTENDYDSLGAGLYAGYMFGNFGLSGDFMYTHVKNDIDQKVAGYGTLSAEGDTDVISLGLRAEYKYETAVMDIIPHAGIRYNHVDMDDMTFSGQLTTIADSANIWQLPVGVTFSREIAAESGWNVKPSLDLSLIPAFGDTDMEQSVRFAGVNGLATMNTEIMDELSGRAQVGIEASKGNFYMGLDYAYQGSSNIDAHQVQANFGFKF